MDSAEYLHKLSESPEKIRNFCMVAHVDHGKTTLSDFLVASNGILSPALAGKVRLLDSRPDEQERLITMKASSIALHHKFEGTDHLLHLVDSPGHIDFSCEVSTAVRLCDGALIIVDLVDGVTMQTCSMLRHVYREGLSMCLVLNKVDLLITRQQLTAEEAYYRMRGIIELCNATLAAFANQLKIANEHSGLHLEDPSDDVWFCPTKGNVLFSSCFDGWGFTVENFAKMYEEKLGIPNMQQYLWGEHYLDLKTKSVSTTRKKSGQPPLALQLMIEPIWQLHKAFLADEVDEAGLVTMSTKLGIAEKVWNRPRLDMRSKLSAIMSNWMPLAKAVLDAVCRRLDSPVVAHKRRLPALIPNFQSAPDDVKTSLLQCSSAPDAPPVAYICKLIDTEFLAGQSIGLQAAATEDNFIGFARVYSGRLVSGQSVIVHSNNTVTEGSISKLYLLRGLGLEEVPEVCSGCLCGIAGLTPLVTKYATVCTRRDVPPFAPLALPSTSIVRLSVHPKDPMQLQQLIRGLHMLNKVDPQVEISILPTGEHVIGTAGEVHAERCIKDLHDTFARIEIAYSEPIVSFRETVVPAPGKPKTFTSVTPDGAFSITVQARALPQEVVQVINQDGKNSNASQLLPIVDKIPSIVGECEERKKWSDAMKNGIVAWGPSKFNFVGALLLTTLDLNQVSVEEAAVVEEGTCDKSALFKQYRDSIVAGFGMACMSGPMAEEPVFGVAFVVTDIEVKANAEQSDSAVSGQVMVATRDACRKSMELIGRRLVEPIYCCVVYSSGATQGKIYAILSRRRSEILEEVPNEGSDLFYVSCHLPAVEAFGLQDELRIATHGAATAQLQMSHWAIVDADPYYKPTTKEELEENGAVVSNQNIGAALLERVRRRKGLHREIVVESAEKQRFSMKGA